MACPLLSYLFALRPEICSAFHHCFCMNKGTTHHTLANTHTHTPNRIERRKDGARMAGGITKQIDEEKRIVTEASERTQEHGRLARAVACDFARRRVGAASRWCTRGEPMAHARRANQGTRFSDRGQGMKYQKQQAPSEKHARHGAIIASSHHRAKKTIITPRKSCHCAGKSIWTAGVWEEDAASPEQRT